MKLKRVVVTGMGAITPVGNTREEFWQGLLEGKNGAGPITRFNAEHFKTRFACEVKGYDPANYFEKKESKKMDLFTQFAMIAADEAVKDANIGADTVDLNRVGVIWGSGIGGLSTFQEEISAFATGNGTPRFNPFFIPKMIVDICAGHISIKYGFRGMNFVTVSACASGTNAIVDAFNYIRLGKADIILCGGAEAAVTGGGVGGFNALKALSERNDDFMSASRPFDKDRDGFVLGEGAGALALEDLDHALARGAKIYGEVLGGGMSADAYHITAPHPDGLGARSVMIDAIKDAQINPNEIDYINVHGTSTPLGDISETKAIIDVFGDHAYKLNISSTKSMTGHLLGATGAIEAIASILAIRDQIVPPTINHFTDDENIDSKLNLTFHKAQKRAVNATLSNTFGFGGHNFSVIFKKFSH